MRNVERVERRGERKRREEKERRLTDNGTKENVPVGRASLTEGHAFAFIYTWHIRIRGAHATLTRAPTMPAPCSPNFSSSKQISDRRYPNRDSTTRKDELSTEL